MKQRYRISPQGGRRLTEAEVAAHKDGRGLFYNYHQAVKPLYKRPLYKDPKAFIALLIIVLLAILISEAVEEPPTNVPPTTEQTP